MQKKFAVMIYPHFSLQEITCLTSHLALWEGHEIVVFASTKDVIKSEEGFSVIADKTFDEFYAADFNLLILPGIINPLPALFDNKNIEFLRTLKSAELIIASISSSPLLLAKAGLLDNVGFTSGLFVEMMDFFDFVPKENAVFTPVCRDKNVITAIGFAFREFATEVLRAIGVDCENTIQQGVVREYSKDELMYRMDEELFRKFVAECETYL